MYTWATDYHHLVQISAIKVSNMVFDCATSWLLARFEEFSNYWLLFFTLQLLLNIIVFQPKIA